MTALTESESGGDVLLLTTTEHRAVAHAFAPHEFVRIDSKRCVLDFVPAAKRGFGLVSSPPAEEENAVAGQSVSWPPAAPGVGPGRPELLGRTTMRRCPKRKPRSHACLARMSHSRTSTSMLSLSPCDVVRIVTALPQRCFEVCGACAKRGRVGLASLEPRGTFEIESRTQ